MVTFRLTKVFQNKKTKQFLVTIPSKKLKATDPTIKSVDDLHKKWIINMDEKKKVRK